MSRQRPKFDVWGSYFISYFNCKINLASRAKQYGKIVVIKQRKTDLFQKYKLFTERFKGIY